MIDFNLKKVHIENIALGDTVSVDGQLKTVGKGDIKSGFMGRTLFGDSYKLGTVPVLRAYIKRAQAKV